MKRSILLTILTIFILFVFIGCNVTNTTLVKESQNINNGNANVKTVEPKTNTKDEANLQDFFSRYKIQYNDAIKSRDFSKIESMYLKDSESYKSLSDFLNSFNDSDDSYQILDINIKNIENDLENKNQYKVFLTEKSRFIPANKPFHNNVNSFVFTLLSDKNNFIISDIKEWNEQDSLNSQTKSSQIGTNSNFISQEQFTYINKKMGFSLTFPSSWQDKYVIKDNKNGITIFHKFQDNHAQFFSVGIYGNVEKWDTDKIPDDIPIKKLGIKNNQVYIWSKPDDQPYPSTDEYKKASTEYFEMNKQIESIISTFKFIEN